MSEVRLSTAVMAHPRRRDGVLRLQQEHPELDIQASFDPEPDGPPATLRAARAAWAAVSDDATHHLVLQDDVLLCRDFAEVVTQALRVAPAGAIALFAQWSMACAQAIRLAALAGASWTRMVDGWTPTQALILPAQWAREFAEYAESVPDTRPDNRVMAAFLGDRGRPTYVAIPNLVEHGSEGSLLMNDLLHGVRNATAFAGDSAQVAAPRFSEFVVDPPAVSYIWLGAGEYFSCYDPLDRDGGSMVTPTHEVLAQFGMSAEDLVGLFDRDRELHPELKDQVFASDSFLFSQWLTMFASGIIAGSLIEEPYEDALRTGLDRPWAAAALATFPASTLRKLVRPEVLYGGAKRLTPFCITALRSGLSALGEWPSLTALWQPRRYDIRPGWART